MIEKYLSLSKFTLIVALCISAIAAWYSVAGLTAIFAGAVIPIIIMGSILEIAKITTTVWLHKYWNLASMAIKTYLTAAVIILAFLTSMGIFGFLSKSHSDTGVTGGDVSAQIALLDEKIKTQRDNIDTVRRALQQMDDQVNQRLSRSDNEQGAERAVQIRRQQAPERAKLQKEIADAQAIITQLNEEKAPIAANLRKVDAEVGPIKYIAALIYGDNPDSNLLERAVRWVIIVIVIVFDPLAIILILAANNSLKWEKEKINVESGFVKEQSTQVSNIEKHLVIPNPSEEVIQPIDAAQHQVPETLREASSDAEPVNNQMDKESDKNSPETVVDFRQGKYNSKYNILEPKIVLKMQSAPEEVVTAEIEQHDDTATVVVSDVEELNSEPEVLASVAESDSVDKTVDEIETDGVTSQAVVFSKDDGYVTYEGKKTSITALRQMRPDLVVDGPIQNNILFGTKFPAIAKSGDIYTRVDVLPHRTFKFNGTRWLLVNRDENPSYLQNTAYIQYLISKIDSGEYDPELLSDNEQDEISAYLKQSS